MHSRVRKELLEHRVRLGCRDRKEIRAQREHKVRKV